MQKVIHTCNWDEGPGISIKFYIEKQQVQSTQLLSCLNHGIELEILSNQQDKHLISKIETWLEDYSYGQNPTITLPLNLDTFPPFAKKVLMAIQSVSFGQFCSYGDLARQSGSARAARAVGSACRRNLFPLIIPCHRVLASGQRLGGYSAGEGLEMKKKLLEYENIYL